MLIYRYLYLINQKEFMSNYFEEMNKSEQASITNTLIRNASDFRMIYLGSAERIIKSLTLINSGGIIAILAYLYKDTNSAHKSNVLSFSLIMFLIGLISIFTVVIYDFILNDRNHTNLRNGIDNFYANKITVKQLNIFDIEIHKPNTFIYICGIISIICAILGIAFGLGGYFSS